MNKEDLLGLNYLANMKNEHNPQCDVFKTCTLFLEYFRTKWDDKDAPTTT